MTKTAKPRAPQPILSGWCGQTAGAWSHAHCAGAYDGHPCRCECHTPSELAATCFLHCGHVEVGIDPQAVHDAMETHYATRHAIRLAAIGGTP